MPPKTNKFSSYFNAFFQAAAAAASIFAFIKIEEIIPKDSAGAIYAIFLVAVTISLAGYIFLIHSRKLHRYADIPPFTHHVNHTIRTVLTRTRQRMASGTLTSDDIEEIELSTTSMLDAISHCFSILTGAQCGVCIKELQHGKHPLLKTIYRDSLSMHARGLDDSQQAPHPIEEDTPCYSIFRSMPSCDRGYICNNVPDEWLLGRYQSPSFARYGGTPQSLPILGMKIVRQWNLRYKSTFVSPIRYRPHNRSGGHIPRPGPQFAQSIRYWGFLCVDAKKRNLFREERHRDVLASFSDSLFIYFNELHDIIDRYTNSKP